MKKNITLILLLLFAGGLFAQSGDYLVIHKPGKKKRYHYYVGDMIIIKPKLDYPIQRGNIYAVSDSAVYFSKDDSLLFSHFEEVIVKENVKPLSDRLWLNNLIVTSGSIGLWQLVYLVNQGTLSPDVKAAPFIIGFTTLVPIIVNQTCRIFVRGTRKIAPGEWQVGVVIMPKTP